MKTKNIFKRQALLTLFALVAFAECNSKGPPGPDSDSAVSFQISQRSGANNGVEFLFKPSADTRISSLVCS